MKKKIYISGPMTGRPNKNKAQFDAAKRFLERSGYEAISPCDKPSEILTRDSTDKEWAEYLKEDIRIMLDCTAVWVLPEWYMSKGARFEVFVAATLLLPIRQIMKADLIMNMEAKDLGK